MISWRLGRSLGIDLLLPPKTCTFDCIYCQLGRTAHKISSPHELEPRVHVEDVVRDLRRELSALDVALLDYITFSGCGEPTLHPELGEAIRAVRRVCSGVPVAILTNASLFWLDEVLENVLQADLIVAKLDAAEAEVFRAINRPAEGITFKRVLEGLTRLGELAGDKMALQVMLLRSGGRLLNADERSLAKLADLIRAIGPRQVQLNTPTRPPAEPYVEPLSQGELERAAGFLAERLEGVEVIYWHQPRLVPGAPGARDLRAAVLAVLERRPCRFHELCAITGADPMSMRAVLDRLISEGFLATRAYGGERFYVLKG